MLGILSSDNTDVNLYLGTRNTASSDNISNEVSMIPSLSFARPTTPVHMSHQHLPLGKDEEVEGKLTANEEGYTNANNTKIPKAPEVSGIEKATCISKFSKFFVCKSCDPDVE